MYAYKEVGLVAVGNACAFAERYVHVGGTCVYDLDVGVVVVYQLAKLLGHREGDVFLLRAATNGAGLCAAVARVYHNRTHMVGLFFLRETHST